MHLKITFSDRHRRWHLANFRDGVDASAITNHPADAMRIAPIGCLFTPDQRTELIDYVYGVSQTAHTSDPFAQQCGKGRIRHHNGDHQGHGFSQNWRTRQEISQPLNVNWIGLQ